MIWMFSALFNKAYGYILRHPATKRGYWGEWYYRVRYEKVMLRLRRLDCKKDITVVELGCGKGTYAEFLERTGGACHYVGCDIERKSLNLAYRGKHISYLLCDVRQLPFVERCADVVLCSEVLEHLSSPYEALVCMSTLATKAILVTFPEERPLYLFRDRHPEHISMIRKEIVMHILTSEKFNVLATSQIFSSFIPCGLLEFLRIPRIWFTQAIISSLDSLMKRIVPSSLVPHKTMLIEARRLTKDN